LLEFTFIFAIGVISSFVGAIAGGTSLISLPSLIVLGLPPHLAVGTNRLGVLGFSIGSASKFLRSGKIVWRYAIPLSVLAVFAGTIGAKAVVNIDSRSLLRWLGILLVILIPLALFFGQKGIERTPTNLRNRATGYVLASFFMLVAAFVGGGIGAVMFFILVSAFGLTILEANATYSLPVLVLTTVSLCIFIPKGLVDYAAGLVLFLGMLTGEYLGTQTALKKGDAWVRKAVVTMFIVLSVKLIIDSFR
jgi:uncharacterized membrane protein YfcA